MAAGYSDSVDRRLGELRDVVVTTEPVDARATIDRRLIREAFELREVPVRFLPPDAVTETAALAGRETAIPVPAGSYLTISQLRSPSRPRTGTFGAGLQPIEIGVTAAAALARAPGEGEIRVDVAVAIQPSGLRGRVEVVAEDVLLLGLTERPSQAIAGETADWTATLAVDRGTALRLIEAENFAGEIRLIPRS